eukprot:m.67164 g.67164  ORF g.67164 m.67164 type:complete len:167 (-) comp12159_c1_seq1:546-1046(-)
MLAKLDRSPALLKTHLQLYNIPFHHNMKYIYLCRNIRDVACSLWNHCQAYSDVARARLGLDEGLTFDEFCHRFVCTGYPFWNYQDHVTSWWAVKDQPNVLFLHYDHMLKDHAGTVKKIARFLDKDLSDDRYPSLYNTYSKEPKTTNKTAIATAVYTHHTNQQRCCI